MMQAMAITRICNLKETLNPLESHTLPIPEPGDGEILIKISACGVCHTELDEIEGRTPPPVFPMVPGHQVVGTVIKTGPGTSQRQIGDRVGIAWIYSACGQCEFCAAGKENLCTDFKGTGRDANGGYAEFMVVSEKFAHKIPEVFSDVEAAPLLCAGAIGYRSLRLTGLQDGQNLGLTGFGASAHLVLKMVRHRFPDTRVMVFARSSKERRFALELGATWSGDILETPPHQMDCVIDTTPVWKPVVAALKHLKPGGRLVINAIRKENVDQNYLLNIDYPSHLWLEKEIKSVANVERRDVSEFLELAAAIPIVPDIQIYELKHATRALRELKERKIRGAKVLKVG